MIGRGELLRAIADADALDAEHGSAWAGSLDRRGVEPRAVWSSALEMARARSHDERVIVALARIYFDGVRGGVAARRAPLGGRSMRAEGDLYAESLDLIRQQLRAARSKGTLALDDLHRLRELARLLGEVSTGMRRAQCAAGHLRELERIRWSEEARGWLRRVGIDPDAVIEVAELRVPGIARGALERYADRDVLRVWADGFVAGALLAGWIGGGSGT